MDYGQTKRTGNTVVHTMLGSLWGTDAYFRRADVAASTNFGIGGSLEPDHDGYIIGWVRIGGMLIPWASGPWNYPGYGDGLKYVDKWGVYGINAYAESIELSGQVGTPVTVRQWRSLVWLIAAILHAADRTAADVSAQMWNEHHREFCTPAYKDCPWPRVYNHTLEYQAAVIKTMQFYEGVASVPDHMPIAGLSVPLPLAATVPPNPKPMPAGTPIFEPFDPIRKGIVYKGAEERQYGNRAALALRTYTAVTALPFVGYYNGETVAGSSKWFVVDDAEHGRIHESGILRWE